MANKANNEFLLLAVVSVVIVVALFIAAPANTPSGQAFKTTCNPTGTTWTCTWDNKWTWIPDTDGCNSVPDHIGAENSAVGCLDSAWYCTGGEECNVETEGQTCECGQQGSGRIGSGG